MEVLGASNRTRVISSLKRNKGWLNVQNKTEKRAAVLVPLLIERSEPSILFTVRSTLLSRHKGQVSFPGGLADSTDVSATETALREAEEELGIPQNAVDIWGELKSFPDRLQSVLITPVIGSLGHFDLSTLKMNKAEVAGVFTLPLQNLLLAENRHYTRFRPVHSIQFPAFLGGPRRVWGITAFILDLVLQHIIINRPVSSVDS